MEIQLGICKAGTEKAETLFGVTQSDKIHAILLQTEQHN